MLHLASCTLSGANPVSVGISITARYTSEVRFVSMSKPPDARQALPTPIFREANAEPNMPTRVLHVATCLCARGRMALLEFAKPPAKTVPTVAVLAKIAKGDGCKRNYIPGDIPWVGYVLVVDLGQDFARGPGGRNKVRDSPADCVLPSWTGPFGTVGGRCHCQDQLRYGRAGA